ncbi:MAG TPA: hypothetical protein VF698_05095 [Thermoanaerobaculia bacterium]
MQSRFGSAAELRLGLERLARFNEWEEAHPQTFTPQEGVAAVASLLRLTSDEQRAANDDPTYAGARFMLACLGRLPRA